jgi:hypothetical protein
VRLAVPTEVKAGEVFNALVELQSGAPLKGVSFQLAFPKDQVSVESAEEGSFFRKSGGKTSFTHAVTEESATEGRVKGGLMRSDEGASAGQGTVIKLWLKALKPGPVELSVVSAELVSGGEPLPRVAVPAQARVLVK